VVVVVSIAIHDETNQGKTYSPEAFKNIQVHVVFGELIVDAEIGIRRSKEGGIRHGGGVCANNENCCV